MDANRFAKLVVLLSALPSLGAASPVPELHDRGLNLSPLVCKAVSGIMQAITQDAKVTTYCSSFLSLHPATVTAHPTSTFIYTQNNIITVPTTITVTTGTVTSTAPAVTSTVTSTTYTANDFCPSAYQRSVAKRGMIEARAPQPAATTAGGKKGLDALTGLAKNVISTACGCLSLPVATATVTSGVVATVTSTELSTITSTATVNVDDVVTITPTTTTTTIATAPAKCQFQLKNTADGTWLETPVVMFENWAINYNIYQDYAATWEIDSDGHLRIGSYVAGIDPSQNPVMVTMRQNTAESATNSNLVCNVNDGYLHCDAADHVNFEDCSETRNGVNNGPPAVFLGTDELYKDCGSRISLQAVALAS